MTRLVPRSSEVPESSGAPTLSRRHAAGTESARGLLFTILGELVLPAGRPVWTGDFLDLFARLEVEPKAARQALMRTAADGWLTSERVGRRTCWHLTNDAVKLLSEGTDRIYQFTGTQTGWDGTWVVVLARVPETDRTVKHALRTRLAWAGFGSATPGAWISTHADRSADAESVLSELGLRSEALIINGEVQPGQPLSELVTRAWDLDALTEQYCRFMDEFRATTTPDPLLRTIELVHAWRRFPWTDPALPPELLPARWVGTRAAQLFQKRHASWVTTAREHWRALSEHPS